MMSPIFDRCIFGSLARITDLSARPFEIEPRVPSEWDTGDYVVGIVTDTSGYRAIELPSGRNMEVAEGDAVVGAFGTRHATLEMTGSWREIGDDQLMHALTRAGLFGHVESRSTLVQPPLELRYHGHVCRDATKVTMAGAVPPVDEQSYTTPTILFAGTSMSAGKTTAARIVTRRLKRMGLDVLGAKVSGAGRYRDVLSIQDAGADWGLDFVDAGLPSTVIPEEEYRTAVRQLLARMAQPPADVAVVEIGASPLEPYNGAIAVEEMQEALAMTVLCASDPYAVLGLETAFDMLAPDLVTGIATNTAGGIDLLTQLTDLPAFNIRDNDTHDRLDALLRDRLGLAEEVSTG
ncbi:hypothetical protein [Salinibacter ruber]|uniref:hypothetical protein n=1 Tax=Salinibacter ruber TaxID=146919 RepID=UPI000E56DED5|nr:hypothetical protein [Salinibacter ruber]